MNEGRRTSPLPSRTRATMTKITNISGETRGFWHKGRLVSVAPGETVERDLDDQALAGVKRASESFKIGATGDNAADPMKSADLRKQADELGIKIDGRWSDERIQSAIDKKLAS